MEGKLTPEQYREMTGRDPYQQFVGRRRDQDLPTEQDIQRATDRLTAQLDAALEANRVTGAGEAREGLSFEGWWADMSPEFDVDPDYPLTDDHRGMALAGWEARDAEIADLTHQIETYRQNATESTGIVARQTLELSELRKALAAAEREAKGLADAVNMLSTALSFAKSIILSGESLTPLAEITFEDAQNAARAALAGGA